MAQQQRYCFLCEWLDGQSGVLWRYQLFYYPQNQELEMVDIKNRKHFLKRIRYPEVTPNQLFIGSTVVVYSRQLKLTDYGDEYTRNAMEAKAERTLAMVKPDAVQHVGKIMHAITQSGFSIGNMRMCQLSQAEAEEFYAVHCGRPFYSNLISFMTSGTVVALELIAPGAIAKWRSLLGPTDAAAARRDAPDSIRAHFGSDTTHNAAHGSDAPDTAAAELAFFFGPGRTAVGRCARCSGSTLGVVKPHAVKDGVAGLLLDVVQEAFAVTALQQLTLDKTTAAEFMEVYKGVVAPGEWSALLDEMTAGPCIAFEVADKDGGAGADVVETFRQLCGPQDPELARVLRPRSLRAQFGSSRVRNALHCTDLPEDGALETNYIFSILAGST